MFRFVLIGCAFVMCNQLAAQLAVETHPVLKKYIQIAIDSNLVIKQKTIALEKSLLSLQEAKSYFLPSSNFYTAYQLAGGGRSISIPVGDLLNPVYATLNQLTGSSKFPAIDNVSEKFLANSFLETRIRTTYPIINTDLKYNKIVKTLQTELSESEIAIYKRELIKEVKTAYFNYLMAAKAVSIYTNTLEVVAKSLRINQSLFNNGKSLPAYINRSESEVQQVTAQIEAARNELKKATAYFNFLLNQPLSDTIEIIDPTLPNESEVLFTQDAASISNREELAQLQTAEKINQTLVTMNEKYRIPKVNSFLDLGAQAFTSNINKESLYFLTGLQVDIPLFNGKRNQIKIAQARKEVENIHLQQQQVSNQLELAAFAAKTNVQTSCTNYFAAQKQVLAAKAYFNLIDKGRTEGVNSYLEWLDAQSQLTNAQIQEQILKFKILVALADYERQIASH